MTREPTPEVAADAGFVNHLIALGRRAENADSQARAALARLRRSAGERSLNYAALRDIGSFVPADAEYRLDAYVLVAGLFAIHPAAGGRGSFAASLRALRGRVAGKDSLDLRFEALLNGDREDLPYRLRQAVRMLAGQSIPVDWHRLLRDVLRWNADSRLVQRRWASDYYVGH